MGCGATVGFRTLSKEAKVKAEELFTKIDFDGDGNITREEAQKFFKSFGKVNAKALFDEVDDDSSNGLSKAEFMLFWDQVRSAGYTNRQITDELDLILDGGDWVNWKDGKDVKVDGQQIGKKASNKKENTIVEKGGTDNKNPPAGMPAIKENGSTDNKNPSAEKPETVENGSIVNKSTPAEEADRTDRESKDVQKPATIMNDAVLESVKDM